MRKSWKRNDKTEFYISYKGLIFGILLTSLTAILILLAFNLQTICAYADTQVEAVEMGKAEDVSYEPIELQFDETYEIRFKGVMPEAGFKIGEVDESYPYYYFYMEIMESNDTTGTIYYGHFTTDGNGVVWNHLDDVAFVLYADGNGYTKWDKEISENTHGDKACMTAELKEGDEINLKGSFNNDFSDDGYMVVKFKVSHAENPQEKFQENLSKGIVETKFGQTEARSIMNMINEFRTGDDAWYWNSSDTEKIYCQGLSALQYDVGLEQIAMQRAAEIAVYYSHTRPNGQSCFTAYKNSCGICGENIAMGQKSAEAVNKAWREDNEDYAGQGHRRNILGSNYKYVGVGHAFVNGKDYWVEEFASSPFTGVTYGLSDGTQIVNVDIGKFKADSWNIVLKEDMPSELEIGDRVSVPEVMCIYSPDGSYINSTVEDTPITVSVSDSSIADLDDNYILVKKAGTFRVTFSCKYATKVIAVKVVKSDNSWSDSKKNSDNAETGDKSSYQIICPKSVTIKKGEYKSISATTYFPATTSVKKWSWKSSNKKIAKVSDCVVYGRRKGKATVTVTVTYKDGMKKSKKIKVKVK